jgi:hypothetical protein
MNNALYPLAKHRARSLLTPLLGGTETCSVTHSDDEIQTYNRKIFCLNYCIVMLQLARELLYQRRIHFFFFFATCPGV